ncbi:MAG TPA: VTT domain-containing protein [Candidatus Eisenbacteria bacterium]|nr:VTT domain-containing protein [Candidatus Eisenbacteria bacterium]
MSHTAALGPAWLDSQHLISTFGLWGIAAIIFAECGLLVGFFLPGDSLLFTAGLLVAEGSRFLDYPLWLVCVVFSVAAVAGNQVGYAIGRRYGPKIFDRPDSRLFRQEYVDKTYGFFDKYGGRAIVLARFVPIVRTFITVTAGVGRMNYRHYTTYTLIGGALWGTGVTVLGYFLGQVDFVRANIEKILILIVLVSVVPIAIELLRAHRRNRSAGYESPVERDRVTREDIHPDEH